MANIRDVAEKANVAVCTVSRVLNGSSSVSQKTRDKVLKVIQELDYTPNELARGMFKQKSGIVAMLVPSISHPFFSGLASHIESQLFKAGYKMMLCSTSDYLSREREYMKIFKSNMVDGVILGVRHLERQVFDTFQKPLILLDDYINNKIPVVVSNHRSGGRMAADLFIKNQCKHVIHLCDVDADQVLSYQSHIALTACLNEKGILTTPVNIRWSNFDFPNYYALAKKTLEEDPSIDGVMAADMAAMAFLKAAIKLGKKVPQEFSVIAYDGTYVADMNLMELTTIVQPLDKIAARTVELMIKMIENKPFDPSMVVLEVTLRPGETT